MKILKKTLMAAFIVAMGCISCTEQNHWRLVYEENFDKNELDPAVWRRTYRGPDDWDNTQSSDPRLMELRDGLLVLRGIENDNLDADTAHFLTGGVMTKGLKAFPAPGRYEVRARLKGARGAWPAIWIMPFDTTQYTGSQLGEVDLMERLNSEDIAYQTVHSDYTIYIDEHNPPHGATGPIDRDGFNVYSADILPDSIVLRINGTTTLVYPRVPELEEKGQYPFMREWFMLIDMQLGGRWVGKVEAEDLPAEMEIDWVRVYEYVPE